MVECVVRFEVSLSLLRCFSVGVPSQPSQKRTRSKRDLLLRAHLESIVVKSS
jgi:hypothetical protein